MGVLRKIGGIILAYVLGGVIMYFLLLNGFVSINEGNVIIDILHMIFNPVILAVNFIFWTLPFVP
jgi:hypothetical protein